MRSHDTFVIRWTGSSTQKHQHVCNEKHHTGQVFPGSAILLQQLLWHHCLWHLCMQGATSTQTRTAMSLDTPFRCGHGCWTNCEQHASVTLVTRQPRTHTCVDINTPSPCKTPSQWIARARLHPLRSTFANKRAPLVHIPTSQAARAGSGRVCQPRAHGGLTYSA